MAKLAASATNDAVRPKATVNSPPKAAPMASMAPQVADIITVAVARCSGSTRLGSAACDDGMKKAPRAEMVPWATKASQTVLSPRTSRNRQAAPICSTETRIISWRRSKRSAAGPASGVITNDGSVCETKTRVAARSEWVRSRTKPSMATLANQSPM